MAYIDKINIGGIEYDIQDSNLKNTVNNIETVVEPSKNLLPITGNGIQTIRGVNVQYEDGIVTLQGTGTSSGGRNTQLFSPITLEAGVYTYSANAQNSIFLQDVSNNIIARLDILGRKAHTFELANETQVYIGANVVSGQIYDLVFHLQLEKNSFASPWSKPSSFSAIDFYARNKLLGAASAIIETASGAVASFDDGADRVPAQKLIVNIEPVQAGSGDPSPDNVRPITEWTGAVIKRTGVNVWDEKWENGYITILGGLVYDSGYIRSKNYIMVSPGASYYCKTNGHPMYVCQYDSNKQFISNSREGYTDRVITVRQDCHYIKFNMGGTYGGTYNNDLAINYPSTATSYEPYQGNQISVAFPSSAGTVYGCKITLNPDKTGTLAVIYEGAILNGTHNVSLEVHQGHNRFIVRNVFTHPTTYTKKQISSIFAYNTAPLGANNINNVFAANGKSCYIRYDEITSIDAFNSYFTENPQTFVVELNDPIIYQLTAEQVSGILETLYGTNNIWSDTGDTTVDYVADTKLYIEKLTQLIEDDMTTDLMQAQSRNLAPEFSTSRTYEIGEYVTQDGALYVCTTAVEEAGAWNTANWQAVTFGEEITELENKTTELENKVIRKTDFSNYIGSMSGKIENSVIARPDSTTNPQQYIGFAPFQNAAQLIINKIKSNAFTIGFSTTPPTSNTQLNNVTYHSEVTEVLIDTPDKTGYVVIQYYNSTTENPETVTQQEVLNSIKVIGINVPTDTTLTQQYVAADAKKVGEELANLRSTFMYHNPYKCIQWVQNAGTTATGLISSLTVIGSKLFMFKYVTKNTQTTGNKIYTFNSDGTVTVTGNTFTSNIGYVNSVDWNPLTNYLVAPHQPMAGDAEQIYALYLFPNVTEDTRAFDTAANGVVRIDIDMSIFESSEAVFGQYQLSAVWGPDDLGKGDLLYVISDDSSSTTSGTRRLALLQLGKGNNIFTYGTAVSGVSTTQFNGTFNVVNTWVQSRTSINGISQGSNDLTYWGGKIYELPAPTSTAGFPLMIHSFDDFGATWKTERILIPYRNANGTASKHEKKGIAIYGEHIYIGSQSNGLYVLDRN